MAYKNPQELIDALLIAQYKERNAEKILLCVTDDIEWLDAAHDRHLKGKDALEKALKENIEKYPNSFSISFDEENIQMINCDVAIATITGKQDSFMRDEFKPTVRGTACCVKTPNGWLVKNIHTSVINFNTNEIILQNFIDDELQKQTVLLDNVLGGVAMYRVKKDGRIATDYVSDGLARICGYDDAKDIMKVMAYDSRKLVLTEDYPAVAEACHESITKGIPTSVNYRIYGKDKTPIRITLDSVVIKDAILGDDDVAVFYAVQTLVSEKAKKAFEEQEVLRFLLDTFPAGLGIFEMKDGVISQNYMNNAFYKMIGSNRISREEFFGENTLDAVHPKDKIKIKEIFNRLLDGEDNEQLDYRMKNDNGDWIWIHSRITVAQRKKNYVKVNAAFYECTQTKNHQLQLIQNQYAVELGETYGNFAIWTYNIDEKIIIQQTHIDADGNMGYPVVINNVPMCFIEQNNVHPDDVDKFLAAYKALDDGNQEVDETYRLIDLRTGKYNWVHMFYKRMDDKDDAQNMAVGFSMRVDEQQEAIERYNIEQNLRKQMYADAVVYTEFNLTSNQYEGDNNLAKAYRSRNWEQPNESNYKDNLRQNVDEPYLDTFVNKMYSKNLLKAFEKGETRVTCEYRSRAQENKPANWYRATAVMIKRPDTGDVMAFIFIEDIEKIKKRQLALESSMSDGIESIALIHIADQKAQIVRSSFKFGPKNQKEYFIYNEDFVDRSHKRVVEEEADFSYHAALLSTIIKELKTQNIYQYSISVYSYNNELKRQLFRFRYLDDRKADIVMSVSDITTVYLEEQEKKALIQNALQNVQKASNAKAEFYSRMSHDMRTPMNGILGMAELSEDETSFDVLKENMKKVKESGEYLLSLVNDTLDIQRIESGKLTLEPKIVSTLDVVSNIIDMVSVTAKAKGVNLKYSKGNTDLNWYINADPLRLKQIFVNLLSNAIKFTPTGGTVELEFKLLSREGMISHDVVYVRDNGIGMSKEFLENGIFKPFSQESNAVSAMYAGSGLGLSIAKSLVELMNGKIEVESELGVGTTFAIYIDFERVNNAEAELALKEKKKEKANISASLKGKKILIAEDHPLNAEITKKLLQKAGCQVIWAKDGAEVVSTFEKSEVGFFDAILMDIRMPVMDGLEATKKIRELNNSYSNSIPIIAMSANAYSEDVKKSIDSGMNSHLAKPVDAKLLYQTLAEFLS